MGCDARAALFAAPLRGRGFPFGTLFVNVTGSVAMGVFYIVFFERYDIAPEWRAALVVGFLGAFTTFSTFSMDTLRLIQPGEHAKAGMNVALSVVLCLAGCWLGMAAARQFRDGNGATGRQARRQRANRVDVAEEVRILEMMLLCSSLLSQTWQWQLACAHRNAGPSVKFTADVDKQCFVKTWSDQRSPNRKAN